MKKLLFVLLAMTIAFGMISCGDDPAETVTQPQTPPPSPVTITFTVQAGFSAYTGTVPASPITIPHNTALGTDFPADLVSTDADYGFTGWYAGTRKVDSTTLFTASTTVEARFDVYITINFEAYSGATAITPVKLFEGQSFVTAGKTAQWPGFQYRTGYVFQKWYNSVDNNKEAVTTETTFAATTSLVGDWLESTLTPDSKAKAKVALENGAHVIVSFDISDADFDWKNYSGITAEYKLSQAARGQNLRALRLYGVYKYSSTPNAAGYDDFKPSYGDFVQDPNEVYVAKYDTKNAAYIMHDKGGAWNPIMNTIPGAMVQADPNNPVIYEDDTWFTLAYPIDGTGKHSNFVEGNLPGGSNNADETTVYFGIGISGYSSNNKEAWTAQAVQQLIGTVTLVGKEKAKADWDDEDTPEYYADIVGKLDFNNTGKLAFCSQIDPIIYSTGVLNPTTSTELTIPVYTPPATPAVPATADYTVTGGPWQNTTAATTGYEAVLFVPITFPLQGADQLEIASFAKVVIKADFYLGGNLVAGENFLPAGDAWGYGNVVFVKDTTDLASYKASQDNSGNSVKNMAPETSNLHQNTKGGLIIPSDVITASEDFAGFIFKCGATDKNDTVKIVEIKFLMAE